LNQEAEKPSADRTIFADSVAVLRRHFGGREIPNAEIRTTAPYMILESAYKTYVRHVLEKDRLDERMGPAALQFYTKLYDRFLTDARLREFAFVAARVGTNFPNIVHKAMFLEERDFNSPVDVIKVAESGSGGHQTNMPWAKLLAANPQLKVHDVSAEQLPDINRRPSESVGFLDRQRLGGWEKIGFQVVDRFNQYVPASWTKGDILLVRHNLLLRETALSLVARNYRIRTISEIKPTPSALDDDLVEAIRKVTRPIVEDFLSPFVVPAVVPALLKNFEDQIIEATESYLSGKTIWREKLKLRENGNAAAVLTNMLPFTNFASLHSVCGEMGLPLIAFQHGVAREICESNWIIQSTFEGNTAHHFLAFNEEAVEVSAACHFNEANNVAVGLPAAYWRCHNFRSPASGAAPIVYVSTKLYCGNVNYVIAASTTDHRMAMDEWDLVEKVLSKLPHKVLFKPYPNARYLDEDPIIEKLDEHPNISVFEHRDDLSFLLPDCRIVVAARATSTIAWCATSDKPLVFINIPWDKPIRPEARQAFEDAFFFFDAASQNFHDELKQFLSLSMEEIERLWRAKAAARKETVEKFFGIGGMGAGKRAADHIIENILA